MWTDCIHDIKSKREFPEWQQKFIDFMFKVNDTSGMEHVGVKGIVVMVFNATLSEEIEINRCLGCVLQGVIIIDMECMCCYCFNGC